jgi:alanine dehydrogenase
MLMSVGDEGGVSNLIKHHEGFRNGVYFYKGTLVNEIIGEAFGMPWKHLDLLIAAF